MEPIFLLLPLQELLNVSYFDNILLGRTLFTISIAAIPRRLQYVAPTMTVHSRMKMAALNGRQICFDGGHKMQTLF